MISVHAFDHVVLNVSDVERSARWYESVLGMRRIASHSGGAVRTSMVFGRNKVNLRPVDAGGDWFTAANPQVGSDDLCFLTDAPPDLVVEHLGRLEIPVELGPRKKRRAGRDHIGLLP
jgi:catechol 2,3-dioxygenase-like lactoylglutathione lyase family enzyme